MYIVCALSTYPIWFFWGAGGGVVDCGGHISAKHILFYHYFTIIIIIYIIFFTTNRLKRESAYALLCCRRATVIFVLPVDRKIKITEDDGDGFYFFAGSCARDIYTNRAIPANGFIPPNIRITWIPVEIFRIHIVVSRRNLPNSL